MTACQTVLPFDFSYPRTLAVQFSSLELSSDAGILLARQADEFLQLTATFAACITETRDPTRLDHPLAEMIAQRVYQLVGGYEDAVDSNHLRHDPIYKVACGRLPEAGAELLSSQPTMSRLENRVSESDIKALRRALIGFFIARYTEPPDEIVLDIDGWDAPTYGEQQLSFFHGYYGHSMYFPVLLNEAHSGFPLVLQLRPGNSHPGKGVGALLRWVFWRLRQAWPQVRLVLRADAGFALPELLRLCERCRVDYVIGFKRNAVTERKIANVLEHARLECIRTGDKARLFDDVYYAAARWPEPRRLVMKAEWLPKGPNPRFVLTSLDWPPQQLYDAFYVQRGADSEHRIKELKLGLNAGRLSCRSARANQFRLLLAQAAYILLLQIRQAAKDTPLATAHIERLRHTVIKVAAKVSVSTRRVLVELAAHCPYADVIQQIVQQLSRAMTLQNH